jgi:hypothetical protein
VAAGDGVSEPCIRCYSLWRTMPDNMATACERGHTLYKGQRSQHTHVRHDTLQLETCVEHEARIDDQMTAHGNRLAEVTAALGVDTDDVPTWAQVHKRVLQAVSELQDKARKLDAIEAYKPPETPAWFAEKLDEIREKARKWDAHERVEAVRPLIAAGKVMLPEARLLAADTRLEAGRIKTPEEYFAVLQGAATCTHAAGWHRGRCVTCFAFDESKLAVGHCGVAQPVEQRPVKSLVGGSNPPATAKSYARLVEERAEDTGKGLAARHPDATKPGPSKRSEHITVDLSGDWD